jgi:hypothetical protein
MFARIISHQINIDKLDEAAKRIEDRVIPAFKSQKGFRGLYLLSGR